MSEVKQVGVFDAYEWTDQGLLHYVRSFAGQTWARRFVDDRKQEGRQILLRRVIVEKPEWYQYDAKSASGLGYAWDQNLDRFVEQLRQSPISQDSAGEGEEESSPV